MNYFEPEEVELMKMAIDSAVLKLIELRNPNPAIPEVWDLMADELVAYGVNPCLFSHVKNSVRVNYRYLTAELEQKIHGLRHWEFVELEMERAFA